MISVRHSIPKWLYVARSYEGLSEIPGAPVEPTISRWLKKLNAWWDDDETPWCGTAMAGCFSECDIPLPKHWYRAKGWLEWGDTLIEPRHGCIVVFDRTGGGHVGLVEGITMEGRLMVRGGNQRPAPGTFSVRPFDLDRVIGYRWPAGYRHLIPRRALPLLPSSGEVSRNEA